MEIEQKNDAALTAQNESPAQPETAAADNPAIETVDTPAEIPAEKPAEAEDAVKAEAAPETAAGWVFPDPEEDEAAAATAALEAGQPLTPQQVKLLVKRAHEEAALKAAPQPQNTTHTDAPASVDTAADFPPPPVFTDEKYDNDPDAFANFEKDSAEWRKKREEYIYAKAAKEAIEKHTKESEIKRKIGVLKDEVTKNGGDLEKIAPVIGTKPEFSALCTLLVEFPEKYAPLTAALSTGTTAALKTLESIADIVKKEPNESLWAARTMMKLDELSTKIKPAGVKQAPLKNPPLPAGRIKGTTGLDEATVHPGLNPQLAAIAAVQRRILQQQR